MTIKTPALRRRLLGAALAATVAAAGLLPAVAACARQDAGAQAGMGDQSAGQMGDHGGRRGHGLHARVDHMLTVAGATPQQKAKIQQILKSAFEQSEPLRRKAADAHRELGSLLTAPKIDRAAIERARADHISALDQSGRIMVKAFADAAEVLSPEQRARIAGAMTQRRRPTLRSH